VVVQRGKQKRPEGKKKKRKECSCACVVLDVHFLHLYCFLRFPLLLFFRTGDRKLRETEKNHDEGRGKKKARRRTRFQRCHGREILLSAACKFVQMRGKKKMRKEVRSEKMGEKKVNLLSSQLTGKEKERPFKVIAFVFAPSLVPLGVFPSFLLFVFFLSVV